MLSPNCWFLGYPRRLGFRELPLIHRPRTYIRLGETGAMEMFFGDYAPSQRPTGCAASMWSQMTLMDAVMGSARSRPAAPHIHPQKSRERVTASAFRWTRRPTIAGK